MSGSLLVKIGGAFAADEVQLRALASALAKAVAQGLRPILVHGGGKDINENIALLSEKPEFIQGMRVTSAPVLKMVEMTLSGHMNKKLVKFLAESGAQAVGIAGTDGGLFLASKLQGDVDLGFVGEVTQVQPKIVQDLQNAGWIPVISPLAHSTSGQTYNINADLAASALANALVVDKLLFVSDVPGVMQEGAVLPTLNQTQVDTLIEEGVISGGMIPKVRSCLDSLAQGVAEVHIVGWGGEEAFLAQLAGTANTGTILQQ
jgi:acetylglutamate kinase